MPHVQKSGSWAYLGRAQQGGLCRIGGVVQRILAVACIGHHLLLADRGMVGVRTAEAQGGLGVLLWHLRTSDSDALRPGHAFQIHSQCKSRPQFILYLQCGSLRSTLPAQLLQARTCLTFREVLVCAYLHSAQQEGLCRIGEAVQGVVAVACIGDHLLLAADSIVAVCIALAQGGVTGLLCRLCRAKSSALRPSQACVNALLMQNCPPSRPHSML